MQSGDRVLPSVKAIRIAAFAAVLATAACAAERSDARAQYLIGVTYYNGTGVEQNYELAVAHLADAAVQDHPAAQYLLAQAFANGRGVTKNPTWAARWYGKAATHGLPEAQYAYGLVHAAGLGLPQNPVRGYAWLLIAERGGHKEAKRVAVALKREMTPEQAARATAQADNFAPGTETRFADPPTVMYVEQVLNGLGFDAGPVDGVLGKLSRVAIRKYQASRGLAADGKVTPELLRRLLDEQKASA